jgi:hypothetical protein
VALCVQYEGCCLSNILHTEHVELILEINKSLLLHLVGLSVLFTYIDDARSNTNQTATFLCSTSQLHPEMF